MTRHTHRTLLVVLALAASVAPLPAQVAAGDRVRLTLQGDGARRVGRVVRLRGDTLWLELPAARGARPDTTFAIPLVGVRRVERSSGVERHVARNARVGTIVGGALGAVIGAVAGAEDDAAGEGALFVGFMGAVPGAAIGALTGMGGRERWEDASLAAAAPPSRGASPSGGPRVRPRLAPTRVPRRDGTWARAIAVGVTVRPR